MLRGVPVHHVCYFVCKKSVCINIKKVYIDFIIVLISSQGSFKELYTSPTGRHVHSNNNSTYLGSIQLRCNYCVKNKHYFFVILSNVSVIPKLAKVRYIS